MNRRIAQMTLTGICAALSIVLVFYIHLPIFPAVAFLEYDPADIPIYMITALFGPWYGLGMTVLVSIIQGITVSAQSGIVGIIMHIVATGSFVMMESLVFYFIRKKNTFTQDSPLAYTFLQTTLAMCAGMFSMTAVMALWNLFLTPYFMGQPLQVVLSLYPFIIAFNLIKAVLNGTIALILYKSLLPILKKVKKNLSK